MGVPLERFLKKRIQLELARLQDEAMDIVLDLDNDVVFHGGTCIWRCYNGKRFSEDLDFYSTKINLERFSEEVSKRGLLVTKFRKTENSIFSKISNNLVEVSIEFALRKVKGTLVDYEKTNGEKIMVNALSKQELILEKARAFSSRKLVRDIYDVYFLTANCDLSNIRKEPLESINSWGQPVDEKNLKALIYSGIIPSYKEMLDMIRKRVL